MHKAGPVYSINADKSRRMDRLALLFRKWYSKQFDELLYYITVNSEHAVTRREESKGMTACGFNRIKAMRTTRMETAFKFQEDDMLS